MLCNPLVVGGVLYGISPRKAVFALDAATGRELWRFESGVSGEVGSNPARGLAYWTDGTGDERLFFPAGERVFAIDARTGRRVREFGGHGFVEPADAVGRGRPRGWVVAHTPGVVYRDLLIQGTRVSEIADAAPGQVVAYDVRSGEIRWTFDTIPGPGEFGSETWPEGAWQKSGGANAWAGLALDRERGIVFVPTGSASYDFYGGNRAGDNLFANSLIALDAATGQRLWHYQIVRHDVWDRDLPAPPNPITIRRGDREVDAVAQVTKSGHVFVFDRETGEPIFPIEEVPVPGGALPGEVMAATQPFPTAPPAFTRQGFREEDVTMRSPRARAYVLDQLAQARSGSPLEPPSREGTVIHPGLVGGAEWGGAAWDPDTRHLFVNANEIPYVIQMVETPAVSVGGIGRATYVGACAMCHGLDRRGDGDAIPSLVGIGERLGWLDTWRIVRDGRGRMPALSSHVPFLGRLALVWYLRGADAIDAVPPPERAADADPALGLMLAYMNVGWRRFLDPDGLPAIQPPWGTLTAIDLEEGTIGWQVPLGDHPQLAAEGIHGTGAENYGGPVVTRGGLVFIAATMDRKIRAFDRDTGAELWSHDLPTAAFATPAVYSARGRQFVVIAVGGGRLGQPPGDRYIAFALPSE